MSNNPKKSENTKDNYIFWQTNQMQNLQMEIEFLSAQIQDKRTSLANFRLAFPESPGIAAYEEELEGLIILRANYITSLTALKNWKPYNHES